MGGWRISVRQPSLPVYTADKESAKTLLLSPPWTPFHYNRKVTAS